MVFAHRVNEFQAENIRIELDSFPGIFATKGSMVETFTEHAELPVLGLMSDSVNVALRNNLIDETEYRTPLSVEVLDPDPLAELQQRGRGLASLDGFQCTPLADTTATDTVILIRNRAQPH